MYLTKHPVSDFLMRNKYHTKFENSSLSSLRLSHMNNEKQ